MDIEPTDQEVAIAMGIDEAEVQRYRRETTRLNDGAWLIHFAYEMPKELRHHFTGSFTALIERTLPPYDLRKSG